MDFNTKWARKKGKLPDRFWYQLNEKSPQENYDEIQRKCKEKYQHQLQQENEIEEQIEKEVEKTLDELMKDILK